MVFPDKRWLILDSAQSYLLHKGQEDFFLRVNFWPSRKDESFKSAGPQAFLYDMPHDHNFNFLTVGYAGPGYTSDYYEYNEENVIGYPSETVACRFTGQRKLDQGKVMLYRKHKDIHSQHPPDDMSISINLMDQTPEVFFREQYVLADDTRTISKVLNRRCNPTFLTAAAVLLGDRAVEPLMSIYYSHDSDFARCHALRAAYLAASDKTVAHAALEKEASSPSPVVRSWVRQRLDSKASIFV